MSCGSVTLVGDILWDEKSAWEKNYFFGVKRV